MIMPKKHTPGPWIKRGGGSYAVQLGSPGRSRIRIIQQAIVGYEVGFEAEFEANATLIAAAPALLEALDKAATALELTAQFMADDPDMGRLIATIEGIRYDAEQARAALTAATGEEG